MDNENSPGNMNQMQAAVRAEQVSMLYDAIPASTVANLVIAVLLVFAQWSAIEHTLLVWWLSITVTVVLLRVLLFIAYRRSAPSVDEIGIWGNRFTVGSSVSGLTFGTAGILLFKVAGLSETS